MLVLDSVQAIDLFKDLSETHCNAAGLSKLEDPELHELQRLINAEHAQSAVSPSPPVMASKPALAASENSPDWRPAPPESALMIIETEVTDAFKGLYLHFVYNNLSFTVKRVK